MQVSASQISNYLDCPRKWALTSIAKVPIEPSPAAQFGTDVHAILADYLKHRTPIDESTAVGQVAALAMEVFPPESLALCFGKIEEDFSFTVGEIEYTGRVDLEVSHDAYTHLIHDHKTIKKLKYVKTSEQLKTDPQAMIYASHVFIDHPKADTVWLSWLYLLTDGSKTTQHIEVNVSREHVREELRKIQGIVAKMKKIREQIEPIVPSALTVVPNKAACSKYGGCPFRTLCKEIK